MKNKKYNLKLKPTNKKALGGMLLSLGLELVGNQISKGIQQNQMTQTLEDQLNAVSTGTNPYGFKYGGKLSGSKDNFEYGGDMSHEKGGIQVNKDGVPSDNPVAEVESDEVTINLDGESYVFSKSLVIK